MANLRRSAWGAAIVCGLVLSGFAGTGASAAPKGTVDSPPIIVPPTSGGKPGTTVNSPPIVVLPTPTCDEGSPSSGPVKGGGVATIPKPKVPINGALLVPPDGQREFSAPSQ